MGSGKFVLLKGSVSSRNCTFASNTIVVVVVVVMVVVVVVVVVVSSYQLDMRWWYCHIFVFLCLKNNVQIIIRIRTEPNFTI